MYSPRVLAHDPPPATVPIAGRDFTLGSANVDQALLTAYNPFCLLGVLEGLAGENAAIAEPEGRSRR